MLAESLGGDDGLTGHGLPFGHRGQHVLRGLVLTIFVVCAFEVELQKAFEGDDFAAGHKLLISARDRNLGHRLVEFGVGHLGSEGPLVDQVVQTLLFTRRVDAGRRQIGGTNGLVRLLGALALGGIRPGEGVFGAEGLGDFFLRGLQRDVAEVGRVRPHVSDATSLVQALSHPHGA